MSKEYPLFTFSMQANGDSLSIRSDDFEEIKTNVEQCKEFLLEISDGKRVEIQQKIIDTPTPVPPNVDKPESCTKCSSTSLNYVTGQKNGVRWHAFDCLDCTSEHNGKENRTRIFVQTNDIQKKKPTVVPKTTNPLPSRTDKEDILCEECERKLTFGIIKHCEKMRTDKEKTYLCYTCQEKEN